MSVAGPYPTYFYLIFSCASYCVVILYILHIISLTPNYLLRLYRYDNQVESISGLEALVNLTVLDLSFNAIREMAPVAACPMLQELYVAQNKLREICGVQELQHLRTLDLGANRIRKMSGAGLSKLTNLESLWLGKNKIERIEDVNKLPKLRQLDVQNNRLKSICEDVGEGENSGIADLESLEELYLACNAIESTKGLPTRSPLNTVDLSTNQLSDLEGISQHKSLTELWMTSAKFDSFEQLEVLKVSMLVILFTVLMFMFHVLRFVAIKLLYRLGVSQF